MTTEGPTPAPPTEDLARVARATDGLLANIGELDREALVGPSLLPGWSRAHVVAHLARNADSHRRRVEGALRGEVVAQYAGGYEGRAREIDESAGQDSHALVADLERSAEALAEAWRTVPPDGWGAASLDVSGRERPLVALPARRWQELEVHRVDLDAGYTPADWPPAFVASRLPVLRRTLAGRMAPGDRIPAEGLLTPAGELAWLMGRPGRADLPVLAPWS